MAIEDARAVLPNACETKIICTMNLRYMSPLKKNSRFVDPEQAMGGGNLSVYPWQKTFMFGVDLTF